MQLDRHSDILTGALEQQLQVQLERHPAALAELGTQREQQRLTQREKHLSALSEAEEQHAQQLQDQEVALSTSPDQGPAAA